MSNQKRGQQVASDKTHTFDTLQILQRTLFLLCAFSQGMYIKSTYDGLHMVTGTTENVSETVPSQNNDMFFFQHFSLFFYCHQAACESYPKPRSLCAVSSRQNSTHPRRRRSGAGQPANSGQSLKSSHADKQKEVQERKCVVLGTDKIVL